MEIKNKIILAMDLLTIDGALEVGNSVIKYLDTIKIGYPLVLSEGLQSIGLVKEEFDCNFSITKAIALEKWLVTF